MVTVELKRRLLTAAVLIPLFVWAVLAWPGPLFAALIGLVIVVGAWEWSRLIALPPPGRVIFTGAVGVCLLLFYPLAGTTLAVTVSAVVSVLLWTVLAVRMARHRCRALPAQAWNPLGGAALGVAVLVPAWWAVVSLRALGEQGPAWVLLLFTLVWCADSGAYFAGRRFGRHKLAPAISPGKSIEGVAGGVVAAALAALIGGEMLAWSGGAWLGLVLLTVVTAALSVVGDLLVSVGKRRAGVKDSGHFLPGHGGALDRIDSITAAAPVFYFGLSVMGAPH